MSTERVANKKGRRFKKDKKKANKKKIIIILLILLIIGGIWVSINNMNLIKIESQEEEIKETSEKLLEEKQYKDMKVKDITLKVDESASYFRCKIENITEKQFNQEEAFIVFIKEDNSELARFKYHIEDITAKEEKKISVTTTTKLSDAYDFYIEAETK